MALADSGVRSETQPNWAVVFALPLAAALAPVDYVLAGMVAAGQPTEALCLYLQLGREALSARLAALGLVPPPDRPLRKPSGRHPWVAGDVRTLIQLWVAGARASRIGERLGRSPGSIYAKTRIIRYWVFCCCEFWQVCTRGNSTS